MNGANLSLAFSAGMIATVNPCGFAMLPAYLSYYLGLEAPTASDSIDRGERNDTAVNPIGRAIKVSGAVTFGFLVVFVAMGFAWSSLSGLIGRRLPYFTIVVGLGLVVMGVAMLRGYEPVLRIPRLRLSFDRRELSSMFVYGVTYAVASLSCTIPIFIGIVATTLDSTVVAGLSVFLAYGLGMGVTLTILTLGVALARSGIVHTFRRVLPYVNKISGCFLIVAGAFTSYYGAVEISELNSGPSSPIVSAARDFQSAMQNWVEGVGAGRLALAAFIIVGAAILIGTVGRTTSAPRDGDTRSPTPPDS
ncbi:MAG: cytochrome c biogenesis protein CcdA [Mycobacterium sp.]|jgi:cytochrome c biogenesis protein CcdA|nr:cytochrome c biogenesis protein CcdA [Mycobacterium sp.]